MRYSKNDPSTLSVTATDATNCKMVFDGRVFALSIITSDNSGSRGHAERIDLSLPGTIIDELSANVAKAKELNDMENAKRKIVESFANGTPADIIGDALADKGFVDAANDYYLRAKKDKIKEEFEARCRADGISASIWI